jgi:hypothetical protein
LKATLCLLLLVSVGATVPAGVIEWSSSHHLQWSDYQGRIPYQPDHGAVTAYEVRSTNTYPDWHHVTYEVACVMLKCKSWVKPEFRTDSALLNHERLHFDLAECSARALRSSLHKERMSIKECNQRLQLLRDSINTTWLDVQDRYDAETFHGTIAKEQARWARKIAHTLDSLAAYSEPRFVVELKP